MYRGLMLFVQTVNKDDVQFTADTQGGGRGRQTTLDLSMQADLLAEFAGTRPDVLVIATENKPSVWKHSKHS